MSNYFPSEISKLQGPLLLQSLDANDQPIGSPFAVGDISKLMVSPAQKWDDVRETQTGQNSIIAHIPTSTDLNATFTTMSWSADNLAHFLYGTTAGAVIAGTVTAEVVNGYEGGFALLDKQNVSALVLTHSSTPLVSGTDYTLNAETGLISFLPGSSVVTGAGPIVLSAAYAYAASAGTIEAMVGSVPSYRMLFLGKNVVNGKMTRIVIHKILLDLPKQLDLIADKHAEFEMGGMVLLNANRPVGTSPFWTITKG